MLKVWAKGLPFQPDPLVGRIWRNPSAGFSFPAPPDEESFNGVELSAEVRNGSELRQSLQ